MPLRFEHSFNVATVINFWQSWIAQRKPYRYLEIGSFEGLSAALFLDIAKGYAAESKINKVQLTCIDSWSGGEEHENINFSSVERTFDSNMQECLQWFPADRTPEIRKVKSLSHPALRKLVGTEELFDLIYVDGSHHAADTLADIILCWFLLKVGGTLIIDDYLWKEPHGRGAVHEPKLAIDAFTTIFGERLQIIGDSPLRQIYLAKTSA
jgi:hypothetical protein